MKKNKAGISAVAHYSPNLIRSSMDIEGLINKDLEPKLVSGSIERLTGIVKRHISAEDEYNSTLAVKACRIMFEKDKIDPSSIDLLIFASTGQDILEPATAHIVQAEIGTHCKQVMDVKNACNSFLNALEIAVAFVELGKYKTVLIATGEVPSKAAKYGIKNRDSLQQYLAGYTFGDMGTAVLVDGNAKIATVIDSHFFSESDNWSVAMFPGGGSRYFNAPDAYAFAGDPTALMKPFFVHTKRLFLEFLDRNNVSISKIEHVFVHQTAELFLDLICKDLQINKEKIQITIKEYGNVAAASLPLALDLRLRSKAPKKDSLGLFIGLAGGISIGFTLVVF